VIEEKEIASSSWPYGKMIVFNKHSYLGTDERVEDIDKKVGQIKYFSNNEEDMKADSFSNYYPVGTKLYQNQRY